MTEHTTSRSAGEFTPGGPPSCPELISGLASIVDRYDVLLCDIWGVLHDGVAAHAGAGKALSSARESGRHVILVSNAPRPGSSVIAMLDGMGVPTSAHDGIVTSGDLTRAFLDERPGTKVVHIGPAHDRVLFDGLDIVMCDVEHADIVICTDLVDELTETPEDYREVLASIASRRLPLVCANPDIVVEHGDRLVWCAGSVARLYEEMGGEVIYFGKPHALIYAEAIRRAEAISGRAATKKRVLCIGDALHTDITGACAAGFDSLFIAGGIHAKELGAVNGAQPQLSALARLFPGAIRPSFVIEKLG
ncbi:TIGR01459 family HAD-type hydrolase [Enterovirga rhinocerotis]|uniref:HAD superfamily hydrolase (TIGR01459 family) n=1 Tax=Enterovirga rhinocerotis TaxID=1339210 RepID=A0A4R7C3S7_9HYPH|nr:TIGR01459 family HAD-type hydrolase [Enterovirga rhinocerotis]TDR93048.1 HAD superfamily hydrolase (TIGR01459 family) [Enterovirga rhinocerotis]